MLQTRNRELINEIKAIYLITGLAIRDPDDWASKWL